MPPPDAQIPDDLLDRLPLYFAGQPAAVARVEAWVADVPERRATLAHARQLWDLAAGAVARRPDAAVEPAWERVRARMAGRSDAAPDPSDPEA